MKIKDTLEVISKALFSTFSNGSPANGELWYDGTDFCFRVGGVTKKIPTDLGGSSSGLGSATDIASAGTTNIGALGAAYARITGTTTITAFDTVTAGTSVWVRFAASLTLTHNATTLILPGGASITTAAGDMALMVSEGSGNWRCFQYNKASGLPVVGTYMISNGSIL